MTLGALTLEQLKELCESATKGPWYSQGDRDSAGVYSPNAATHVCFTGGTLQEQPQIDAEFIAKSRELVPALIERVEALQAKKITLQHSLTELEIKTRPVALIRALRKALYGDRELLNFEHDNVVNLALKMHKELGI